MVSIEEEPWFLSICELLDGVCQKVDEKKDKEQQQLKECEERNELEYKIKMELAQNEELTKQLAELNLRRDELSRVCNGSSKPTITDNDQQRLDKAKEAYELGKELTGIRFDFSAPPDRMKGYIKNVPRRVLLPFDMDLNPDSLWELLQTTADPVWSREN